MLLGDNTLASIMFPLNEDTLSKAHLQSATQGLKYKNGSVHYETNDQ